MISEQPKRNTQQKKAIEQVFLETDRPLTMEEILKKGRDFAPSLNQATVYRNLKSLVEDGWLTKVQLPTVGTYYERSNKSHHHHFLCRLCNKAYELFGCLLKSNHTLAPKGFIVENHDVTVYGVCSVCAKD